MSGFRCVRTATKIPLSPPARVHLVQLRKDEIFPLKPVDQLNSSYLARCVNRADSTLSAPRTWDAHGVPKTELTVPGVLLSGFGRARTSAKVLPSAPVRSSHRRENYFNLTVWRSCFSEVGRNASRRLTARSARRDCGLRRTGAEKDS